MTKDSRVYYYNARFASGGLKESPLKRAEGVGLASVA